jgi:hypothetical protein
MYSTRFENPDTNNHLVASSRRKKGRSGVRGSGRLGRRGEDGLVTGSHLVELFDVVVPLLGELDDLVNGLVALLLVLLLREASTDSLGGVHLRRLLGGQAGDTSLETKSLEEAALFQQDLTGDDGWGHAGGTGGSGGVSLTGLRGGGGLTLSSGSSGLLLPQLLVGTSATAPGLAGTVGVEVVRGHGTVVAVTVATEVVAMRAVNTVRAVGARVAMAAFAFAFATVVGSGRAGRGSGGSGSTSWRNGSASLGSGRIDLGGIRILAGRKLLQVHIE